MNTRLIRLGAYLKALNIIPNELELSNKEKSYKKIQRMVYLGQFLNADLGYRFRWYSYGPFSESLAADCASLYEESKDKGEFPNGRALPIGYQKIIEKLKKQITDFEKIENLSSLSPDAQLNLYVAVHYLLRVSLYDENQAEEILKKQNEQFRRDPDVYHYAFVSTASNIGPSSIPQ